MTRNALDRGEISEDTIRKALTSARGDLFVAACYLACTGRELDSYIRSSETLQGFSAAIGKVKKDADYDKMSAEQFSERLETLTRSYKVEALDVIHELATMPFDSAALAEVKLKAAVQLRGAHTEAPQTSTQQVVLQELNALYQQAAPRIKSIRVAQIDYEEGPG